MSETKHPSNPDGDMSRPSESFFSRFHRRKTEARLAERVPTEVVPEAAPEEADLPAAVASSTAEPAAIDQRTDADMPAIESLSADSDFTGFLSPKVSETLRRAALRKLFHGSTFNVIDELDDYAEDFTTFEALGDIVTADMRHQLELQAKKKAEAAKQALLEEDEVTTESNDEVSSDPIQATDTEESIQDPEHAAAGVPAEPLDAETERTDART
jgi:hypothetical protein